MFLARITHITLMLSLKQTNFSLVCPVHREHSAWVLQQCVMRALAAVLANFSVVVSALESIQETVSALRVQRIHTKIHTGIHHALNVLLAAVLRELEA